MTTNIVNIGFKGTYPSATANKIGYVTDGDQNGIFYFLGTNYNTQGWSDSEINNHLIATGTSGGINLKDRNSSTGTSGNSQVVYQFLDCKILPTFTTVATSSSSTYTYDVVIEGSNDNSNWDLLGTVNFVNKLASDTSPENAVLTSNKYYEYLRITKTHPFTDLREWEVYGKLLRTDNGVASFITPITTVEQLPKYIPQDLHDSDLLYYNNGVVTNRRKKLYQTSRLTMTGTLAITNNYFPNFYILNPNGATRNVDLPTTPLDGQHLRFKTLNGFDAISIREPGPIIIATLNTSTPVVDLYYSNNTWTVLSYG